MLIANPFRKISPDPNGQDRLQPIFVLVTPDERDSVIEYLSRITADPNIEIHGSGFVVIPESEYMNGHCIANVQKGYGWYGINRTAQ